MSVLQINSLSKQIGNRRIINDISFSIEEGEIVGLVGPKGSGKTTLVRLITKLINPDKGEILISGYDILKYREKAMTLISAIMENHGLYDYLTGFDNINYIRKINKIDKEKIKNVIEYMGVSEFINDKVYKYSAWMKLKLELGICMLKDPKLLILDEPDKQLKLNEIYYLHNILQDISKNKGTAVLIMAQSLSNIKNICNKILYIKNGKIEDAESTQEYFIVNNTVSGLKNFKGEK